MTTYDFDSPVCRCGSDCIKFDRLKENFGRTDLFPLWIADMDFAVAPEIRQTVIERLSQPVLGYFSPADSYWQSIISWAKRRHGADIRREEIAFVPGIVRGIAFAVDFFSRPGDKIVIQTPVYHPFRIVPEGTGRQVVMNPLIENTSAEGSFYKMDFEGLERIFVEEKPRMMIVCNPHNPAGIQWTADDLARVCRLAKKYGVIVISDEIHGDLMLDGRRHIPMLMSCDEAADVCITFSAPSKTFNIAGLESSWMVIRSRELRDPFYKWMEVNEFSSPSVVAWAAAEAAYNHGEPWLDSMLDYLKGNIDYVEKFCAECLPGIRAVRPEASFLVWLDCRGLGLSHDKLIELFIDGAHLALNDGAMFGPEGSGFMRLNVALPRTELEKCMQALAAALA